MSPIRSSARLLRNGCTSSVGALRAGRPAAGDRGHHVGRGLDRGALHVVQDAADAAELLAAAGAAGAAVHQHRQRRAVAGGLRRRRRGRGPGSGRATGATPSVTSRATSGSWVTSEPTRLPLPRAASSIASSTRVVGQHRADRAERLDVVRLDRALGRRAAARGRGTRRARRRRRRRRRGRGRRTRSRRSARSDWIALRTSSRWPRLASAPMRTSGFAGLPTVIFASRAVIASMTASAIASGTIARRIAVHFWPALTVISVTTPLTNRSNSGSSAVTSGPRIEQFSESASTPSGDAAVQHVGVGAQQAGGVRRAGERHRVLHGRARRAGRRRCRDSSCSEPSGRRPDSMIRRTTSSVRYAVWLAGFTIVGRPARNAGRELLEHPPDREVERVDLHRDAGPRGVDVLADERALPAEPLEAAVEDDGVVGQLAGALAGEAEEGADAALDVDHAVARGGAGAQRQRVELVLDLVEVLGQRLEQRGALVEGQRAQRGAADGAGVRRHLAEVETRCWRSGRPPRRWRRRAAGRRRRRRRTSVRRRSSRGGGSRGGSFRFVDL